MTQTMPNQTELIPESRRFTAAMRTGDVSSLDSILADDIVFMPPADCTLYGTAEVKNWFQEYFEYFAVLNLDETERSVQPVGDVLIERIAVSVKLEARQGGMPIYDEARILSVWRRQPDGSWRLWQSMWNSIKPIGA